MNEMCPGQFLGIYYKEDIPKRVRCPKCKRRVGPSYSPSGGLDEDFADEFDVSIPTHKVRGWYRGRNNSGKDDKSKRRAVRKQK